MTGAVEAPVLGKIRKLLQLAKSENEHEAASAAARAAEMMAEHGLSEAELRVTDASKKAEPIVEHHATVAREDKRIVAWKGSLAHGVADAHGCKMWWRGGKVVLLGRTSATQAADYTLTWLCKEVERLTDEAWAHAGISNAKTWKHSFRIGCATRIAARLKKQARERPELRVIADFDRAARTRWFKRKEREPQAKINAVTPGTALVLLQRDAEEVCDAYATSMKGARSSRAGAYSSSDGYSAGRAAGERVNLASGPGLAAPPKRLP